MRIKFYLVPYDKPTNAAYQHQEVCLAEGLKDYGVEFYGNINYWMDLGANKYLINKAPTGFKSNINIYSGRYFVQNKEDFNLDKKAFNILIDSDDGIQTICLSSEARQFDLILRTHFSRGMKYQSNVRPWAFGLSNRIILENENFIDEPIKEQCYINYRVSHNLRELAGNKMVNILNERFKILHQFTETLKVVENIRKDKYDYWNQTGRRHNKEYYKILNCSILSFAFGGILEYKSSFHRFKEALENKAHLNFSNNFNIFQFDSWRLWEGLLSKSCPVHIDFKDWGVELPEMPVSGVHYIGVKGTHFKKTAQELVRMQNDEITAIGYKGREWVLKHYAPKPTAIRLLKMVK